MKIKLTLLVAFVISIIGSPAYAMPTTHKTKQAQSEYMTDLNKMPIDELLNMTPAKYKEITGKRMKVKEWLSLKIAQQQIKSSQDNPLAPASRGDLKTIILLLLCIIPPLAIFLKEGLSGNFWLSCLLLIGAAILGVLPIIGNFLVFLVYALAVAHAIYVVLDI